MHWSDEGYLVEINSNKENSSIAKVFTKQNGFYVGIIYGSSSSKKKPELQIGNKLKINYKSKTEDSIGYFGIELIENISIKFFNEKLKLNLYLTSLSLLSKVLPERQRYENIFKQYENFLEELKTDNLKPYLIWEYHLLKNLGYGVDEDDSEFDIENIKKILKYSDSDYHFNDLINIYRLNTNILKTRLNEVIDISKINKRSEIENYLNEKQHN